MRIKAAEAEKVHLRLRKAAKRAYDLEYRRLNGPRLRARALKYVRDNRAKVKAIRHAGYIRDRDKILLACKELYRTHAERIKKRMRAYTADNRSAVSARNKRWRQRNPDKVVAYSAFRSALKLHATPPWLTKLHKSDMAAKYSLARSMQQVDGIPRHVDHIYPLHGKACCGLHVPWNLQILTASENKSKFNKMPVPVRRI